MTTLLRFRSCAIALADWLLGFILEEDRPAHDHESVEYRGPERRDDEGEWFT